jgi:PhnB protein
MTVTLSPYINFAGNAREALTYYHGILGGELQIWGFGEFGVLDMPADGVMHGQIDVNEGLTVMASDAMSGAEETWGGTRVYCALFGDDEPTMRGWFDALAADGEVGVPLEKQVWGDTYGLVKDRFGVEWMFNVSSPQAA